MKINVELYDSNWPIQFDQLKNEIEHLLSAYNPRIEHFGSTSVPGLSAKPVIDILVGIDDISLFPQIVNQLLLHQSYIHYKAFDIEVPDRRLFVRLQDGRDSSLIGNIQDDFATIPHEIINQARMAHIHIWKFGSDNWIRHIAFRDYLRAHEKERKKYGELKLGLSNQDWAHGMEYNDGKSAYIKEVEAKAITWYMEKRIST